MNGRLGSLGWGTVAVLWFGFVFLLAFFEGVLAWDGEWL